MVMLLQSCGESRPAHLPLRAFERMVFLRTCDTLTPATLPQPTSCAALLTQLVPSPMVVEPCFRRSSSHRATHDQLGCHGGTGRRCRRESCVCARARSHIRSFARHVDSFHCGFPCVCSVSCALIFMFSFYRLWVNIEIHYARKTHIRSCQTTRTPLLQSTTEATALG